MSIEQFFGASMLGVGVAVTLRLLLDLYVENYKRRHDQYPYEKERKP